MCHPVCLIETKNEKEKNEKINAHIYTSVYVHRRTCTRHETMKMINSSEDM